MFDAVRNNKKIVQIFLLLIALPFAFFGVESYIRNAGETNDAATVGGSGISPREFAEALRDQQDRIRAALGRSADPAMLDSSDMRWSIIESLVNRQLLAIAATRGGLSVSDDQIRDVIAGIPSLQEDGRFSMSRYEAALRQRGYTQARFESQVRNDIVTQQIVSAVRDAAIVARSVSDRWLEIQQEEREVAQAVVKPEALLSKVQLATGAAKQYYEVNPKLFETPEQIRAEYVVLSQEVIAEQIVPSESDIKSWYEGHQAEYRQAEERRASHILISADKDAPNSQLKVAREKISDLLRQVRQSPQDFAKLAKSNSQDPGSAANGGDLGYFPRGAMVKPFEDVAFSLKENQVGDVVRSDFGFHIIKVTGIKPEKARALDEVRGEIAAELKRQGAARKYAELAEAFSNTVYEQSDSLAPVVEKFKLKLQQSDWITKGAPRNAGPLANEKLLAALFSDETTKNKRNTEAVEVAPNTLIAARAMEHKPSSLRPFESVSADIEKKLVMDEAVRLAQKEGSERLAKLTNGENVEISWGAPLKVTRQSGAALTPEAVRGIFGVNSEKLPGYAGAALPNGTYAIFKVVATKSGAVKDDTRAQAMRTQYDRVRAEDELGSYLLALRERNPVNINRAVIEAKEK